MRTYDRVPTNFRKRNSRTFQGFSRTSNRIFKAFFLGEVSIITHPSCRVLANFYLAFHHFQLWELGRVKFKDFSRIFSIFSLIQGLSRPWKHNQFFQGISRIFKDVGTLIYGLSNGDMNFDFGWPWKAKRKVTGIYSFITLKPFPSLMGLQFLSTHYCMS